MAIPVKTVQIQARQIGVAGRHDIIILGGSVAAVEAAVSLAGHGKRVQLVTPQMHLGEDRTLALRWTRDAAMDTAIGASAFPADCEQTTPLRLKKAMDDACMNAGVELVFASAFTELLHDADGGVAGVLIANRAGRQALLAPIVVDATPFGVAAGAFSGRGGEQSALELTLERVVLGGEPPKKQATEPVETYDFAHAGDEPSAFYVYRQRETLREWTPADAAALEATVREATDRVDPERSGTVIWTDLPESAGATETAGLYRLPWGDAVTGGALAQDILAAPRTQGEVARESATSEPEQTDLREVLGGLRPTSHVTETVARGRQELPLLADVDLLVVGGGTSGASAAIAGVRKGLRVLVLEYHRGLGGVGSIGLVNGPYAGRDVGHATEIPFSGAPGGSVEDKMRWFHGQIRDGGGEIWYGCITWGAIVDRVPADSEGRTRVIGAAVATPWGTGAVRARVVMDATGSADIAIAAGAAYRYGDGAADVALQGTGLSPHPLRFKKVNSDYLFIDEHDICDTTAAMVGVRQAMDPDAEFDVCDFIQSRERRTVVGEHTLTYLDQLLGRTYPDSIVLSDSDYDTHGYPSIPFFALLPHNDETKKQNHPAPSATPWTPYRCLLPVGLEGILVVGIGISMERDAAAMVRMQRDVHNQAYAATLAAEQAIRQDLPLRQIDVSRVQSQMIELGALPPDVLQHQDNFPPSARALKHAVQDYVDLGWDFSHRSHALGTLWVCQEQALPLVRDAYRAARGQARLQYACLLAFWGETDGQAEIIAALDTAEWDDKILQGWMAEYAYLPTPVDALVLALGYAGDTDTALPVLLAKLPSLSADVTLSHHRAVIQALELLADPRAAEPLAEHLRSMPGLMGHEMTMVEPLHNADREARRREGPIRELSYARALYRCGDHDGLGRLILQRYVHDLRGLFSRHAQAVLAQPAPEPATV